MHIISLKRSVEVGRMWREAVMVQFKVLSRKLLGGIKENHKKISQNNWSPG
jgi:hypothetical protein